MPILLTDEDVEKILTMKDCIDVLETSYRELGEGKAGNRLRTVAYVGHPQNDETFFWSKTMEGGSHRFGVWAIRITFDRVLNEAEPGQTPRQVFLRYADQMAPGRLGFVDLILVVRTEDTRLMGIVHVPYLQKMRVGGTSGLAAKLLARPDSRTAGLFGSGWQASAQAEAICAALPIESLRVFSPNPAHREAFARRMAERLRIEVQAVGRPEDAVKGVDVVLTATNSKNPVFDGAWLVPGQHVSSIVGGDEGTPRQETDDTVLRRADRVVVNSREHIRRIGQRDVLTAVESGTLSWDAVHELSELVVGTAAGRSDGTQITFFKNNVGLGSQFATVGGYVLAEAERRNVGQRLPDEWFAQVLGH